MRRAAGRTLACLAIVSLLFLFFVGCEPDPEICREPVVKDDMLDVLIAPPEPASDCGEQGSIRFGNCGSCSCTPSAPSGTCASGGSTNASCQGTCSTTKASCKTKCSYTCACATIPPQGQVCFWAEDYCSSNC